MGSKNSKVESNIIQYESNDLFDKISSQYIFMNIIDYIKSKDFILKLFKNSNKYIKKLNLLADYQYYYLLQNHIDLFKYFYVKDSLFNSDIIKIQTYKNIIKINLLPECLEKYIKNYPKFYKNSERWPKTDIIGIYSPFFEIFSETDFIKQFTIDINMHNIRFLKSEKNCIFKFNKLNQSNKIYKKIKYTPFDCNDDIKYLNKINLNFNNIDSLDINFTNIEKKSSKTIILNTIISFKDIYNLISLKINFIYNQDIELNIIENLNNFKNLEILNLIIVNIQGLSILFL